MITTGNVENCADTASYPAVLRQVFLDQLRWYTGIIDELRLEPDLYR